MERAYNLGFSDNRTSYAIGNDGGSLNAPVVRQRNASLAVGERVEIMVDPSNDAMGSSFDMQAFNGGLCAGFPGGEPNSTGQFGSLFNNTTFTVPHINGGDHPTRITVTALGLGEQHLLDRGTMPP